MVKQSRLRVRKNRKKRRILLVFLLVAAIGTAVWKSGSDRGLVDSVKQLFSTVKANFPATEIPRGTVFGRNLKLVAVTLERVSVYARIKEIKSIPETVKELGAIFQVQPETLKEKLESGALRVWVSEDISQEQEIALKKKHLPGVYLQREQKRFYPAGEQAGHLIGYVENNIGLAGVEFFYDRLLAGDTVESGGNGMGRPFDLILTVDFKIQKILEDLVRKIGSRKPGCRVGVWLMERKTGELVGAAQYPGFDPNRFTRYSKEVLEDQFLLPMAIPRRFRLLLRDGANLLGSREAGGSLPWSVSSIEMNLGFQLRLWNWLGLTDEWYTDLSLYKEGTSPGGIEKKLFSQSGGQQFGLVPEYSTPLKLFTGLTEFFSDGTVIRPHAVSAVVDTVTGEKYPLPVYRGEFDSVSETINSSTEEMRRLLKSMATEGSSGTLYFSARELLVNEAGGGDDFEDMETLFALIPADAVPLAMFVSAGSPAGLPEKKGKKNESLIQLIDPVVDRISVLQQVAKSVSDVVEPELTDEGNYPFAADNGHPGRTDKKTQTRWAVEPGTMPDLEGLSLRRSFQLLQHRKLKIHFRGTGRVVSQKPAAGTSLKGVSECVLVLAAGPDEKNRQRSVIRPFN
jgi:cell division protein FtsI (penicillin-binding protein 3)